MKRTDSCSSRRSLTVASLAGIILTVISGASPARAAGRTFAASSLIIPMDLAYQNIGMLQAYGLLFQLLRQGIPVSWAIDPNKTWHAAPCNSPNDLCTWDCAVQGSAVKCPYPTASPDFFAGSTVLWDDSGGPSGAAIANHGYRGGPFLIDAAHRTAALTIINAWNDPALWPGAPWAVRTIFRIVSVHEATTGFVAPVAKDMVAAPRIAVIADRNEDIATGYLRAAGIPQGNGSEFPAARCVAGNCGPGTANPDMLPLPGIMGDMGTCNAMNYDHRNGSLFTPQGLPAFCQVVSAHWNVADRETVQCDGGACPATQAQCTGQTVTYHGHEAVAELREFLSFPVHFFAECLAALAYENTTPNPGWPYLDDAARDGHFLTTQGTPPPCSGACADSGFQCVVGGCGGGTVDCCLANNISERGAGLMMAPQPSASALHVLRPEVAYNQLDGFLDSVGGTPPAYRLSPFLGTTYKSDRQVPLVTTEMIFANGFQGSQPGQQDVWMTGFVDGACDISAGCNLGKVSYLGGHAYATTTPITGASQGTRLFLNGLFEADCVF